MLGVAEGQAAEGSVLEVDGGTALDPAAVLQGAARVLRGTRARGDRARRPHRARPDLRRQAQVRAAGLNRDLVVELWLYPDGSRILELSTKCAPGEAFQVAAEARAFLGERGIDPGGEQQTKTRTALEFFSADL